MKGLDSSRLERMRKDGAEPPYPEVTCFALLPILFDAGPMMAGGMSRVGLTALELRAWCEGSGVTLTGWEFCTVLDMSRAYAYEFEKAQEPAAVAPYVDDIAAHRERVAKRTFAMLRGG